MGALSIGLLCPFDIFSSFFEDFLTFGHNEIFQTHIFPAQTLGSTISLWSLGSFQEIRVFRSQDLSICVLVASRATLLPDPISPFPKTSWKRRDHSSCLCWQLSMQCYFNFTIRKKKTLIGAMESQDPLHFFDTYFFVFKTHQRVWANAGHFLLWTARETMDILEVSRKGFLKNEWTWCEPENTVSGMSCCQLLPLLPSSLSYGSSIFWIVSGTKTDKIFTLK